MQQAPTVRLSVASRVRAWVDAAPVSSVLDVRSAPGAPSNATRVALSHLAAEPFPPVVFVRRHIYWKHGYYPDNPAERAHGASGWDALNMGHLLASVDHLQVARHLAGPGGGYAGWTAGWACGWTRHDAYNFDVAVVGRPPRAFAPNVYFCSRSNERRRTLTWGEVTLMEAVLGFVRSDGFDVFYRPGHDWMCDYDQSHEEDECLLRWPDPLVQFTDRLLGDPERAKNYCPDRIARAAQTEKSAGREFAQKIADAVDAISRVREMPA